MPRNYSFNPQLGGGSSPTKPPTSSTTGGNAATSSPTTRRRPPVAPTGLRRRTATPVGAGESRIASKTTERPPARSSSAQASTTSGYYGSDAQRTADRALGVRSGGERSSAVSTARVTATAARDAYLESRVDSRAQAAGETAQRQAGITHGLDRSNPSAYVNFKDQDTVATAGAAALGLTDEEFAALKEKNRREAEAYQAGEIERAQVAHDDEQLQALVEKLAALINGNIQSVKDVAAETQAQLDKNERTTPLAQVPPELIISAGQKKAETYVSAIDELRRQVRDFIDGKGNPEAWNPNREAWPKRRRLGSDPDPIQARVETYFDADEPSRWFGPSYYSAAFARGSDRWRAKFERLLGTLQSSQNLSEPTTGGSGSWLAWLVLASLFGIF